MLLRSYYQLSTQISSIKHGVKLESELNKFKFVINIWFCKEKRSKTYVFSFDRAQVRVRFSLRVDTLSQRFVALRSHRISTIPRWEDLSRLDISACLDVHTESVGTRIRYHVSSVVLWNKSRCQNRTGYYILGVKSNEARQSCGQLKWLWSDRMWSGTRDTGEMSCNDMKQEKGRVTVITYTTVSQHVTWYQTTPCTGNKSKLRSELICNLCAPNN